MKKFAVTLCLGAFAIALVASPAAARPQYNKEWQAKYVEGNKNEAFVKAVGEAKCNVCHDAASKSKKDRNPYGMALSKFLNKEGFDKSKGDADAAKKWILEGFQKGEAEKAADGKTFGDKLKAGSLPGA
jgi:hypothetical protein